jgi:hypothetical protein
MVRYALSWKLHNPPANRDSLKVTILSIFNAIMDATAASVGEVFIIYSWRDSNKEKCRPEKISVIRDWENINLLRLITSGELYSGKEGWVNLIRVHIGSAVESDVVETALASAIDTLRGLSGGSANICPIQTEDVDQLGWLFMSSVAVDPFALQEILVDELEYDFHISFKNVSMCRLNGNSNSKLLLCKAIHIDCRTEFQKEARRHLKKIFTGESNEFTLYHCIPPMKLTDCARQCFGSQSSKDNYLFLRARQIDFHSHTILEEVQGIRTLDRPFVSGRSTTLRKFLLCIKNTDKKTNTSSLR